MWRRGTRISFIILVNEITSAAVRGGLKGRKGRKRSRRKLKEDMGEFKEVDRRKIKSRNKRKII